LFLQLPGPLASVEAFDDLVKTAERLAAELGGVLRDQDHNAVTHRMLMQVRQQIAGTGSTAQRSAL
jgi:cell division protein ZipA